MEAEKEDTHDKVQATPPLVIGKGVSVKKMISGNFCLITMTELTLHS
jgi:hypothetical protein